MSNMLTWLHANLAGLLRAFISLKWNVTLQGVESFIKRAFFQTYLASKPFPQEHPLGLMCPRAHFGNYCRSYGASLKAFKRSGDLLGVWEDRWVDWRSQDRGRKSTQEAESTVAKEEQSPVPAWPRASHHLCPQ